MTVTFPRTDILSVGFSDQTFSLMMRQEFSRTAGGVTYGKDLGDPLWTATYTTQPLANDDAVAYEAALTSLDGVINAFEAGDLRKTTPRHYPAGDFTDEAVIETLGTNNKSLSLSNLEPGFELSVGDFVAFDYGDNRALHQVMEAATADEDGTTIEFEVRPHIRAGAEVGAAVKLKNASAVMSLQPGSIKVSASGGIHTVISFGAIQVLT